MYEIGLDSTLVGRKRAEVWAFANEGFILPEIGRKRRKGRENFP